MRVGIVGVGALGSVLGRLLSEGGVDTWGLISNV